MKEESSRSTKVGLPIVIISPCPAIQIRVDKVSALFGVAESGLRKSAISSSRPQMKELGMQSHPLSNHAITTASRTRQTRTTLRRSQTSADELEEPEPSGDELAASF